MIKSYSLTITRSEILNLYMGTVHEITIYSISEWLKSKTDKQFIVIEREFVMEAIQYIESSREPLYRDSLSHHRTSDVAYGGFAVMFTKS